MKSPSPCPCGNGRDYGACCGALHQGAPAASAESLMRSRYSAFALGLQSYLLATWHADTRPVDLDLAADPVIKWVGLDIRRHEVIDEAHAEVEFIARYKVSGRAQRLHETSRFVRVDGRWLYLDGDVADDA